MQAWTRASPHGVHMHARAYVRTRARHTRSHAQAPLFWRVAAPTSSSAPAPAAEPTPSALMYAIKSIASWQQLQRLHEQHKHRLTHIHLSAMVTHLAQLSMRGGSGGGSRSGAPGGVAEQQQQHQARRESNSNASTSASSSGNGSGSGWRSSWGGGSDTTHAARQAMGVSSHAAPLAPTPPPHPTAAPDPFLPPPATLPPSACKLLDALLLALASQMPQVRTLRPRAGALRAQALSLCCAPVCGAACTCGPTACARH